MQEFTCVGAGATKASYWEHSYSFLFSQDNCGNPRCHEIPTFPSHSDAVKCPRQEIPYS